MRNAWASRPNTVTLADTQRVRSSRDNARSGPPDPPVPLGSALSHGARRTFVAMASFNSMDKIDAQIRSCLFNKQPDFTRLFVEHCEAVAAKIDIKRRWLGEQ
jgi:hypothetical protein